MWHELQTHKILQHFRHYCIHSNKSKETQKTAVSSYVSDEFKQSNIFSNSKLRIANFCSALLREPTANFKSDKSRVLFESSIERLDTVLRNNSKLLAMFLLLATVTTGTYSVAWSTGGHDYLTTTQMYHRWYADSDRVKRVLLRHQSEFLVHSTQCKTKLKHKAS